MIRRILLTATAAFCLAQPIAVVAQTPEVPAKASGRAAFAPLEAFAGKTWRGKGNGPAGGAQINDIQQWQWDLGGHAIRIVHSVNNGAYAGESVLFPAPDGDGYVYTYVTTGGFYTTGVIRAAGSNAYTAEETVHGVPGLGKLRSKGELGADGVYRVRSSMEKDGQWVETGGFDYVEDATAIPVLPGLPQYVSKAGDLSLSRRILRGAGAGDDVAAYLRIDNAGGKDDRLTAISCACAESIEIHRVKRSAGKADMVTEAALDIPTGQAVDFKPGSELHLMLKGYRPPANGAGTVTMTLTFRDGGKATTEFAIVDDTPAAWSRFDTGN